MTSTAVVKKLARRSNAFPNDLGSWPRTFGEPEFGSPSERERAHREKEKRIVLTRIGLRPGNNLDVLAMLGLIP